MNVSKFASLESEVRRLVVDEGYGKRRLARQMDIPLTTAQRWIARVRTQAYTIGDSASDGDAVNILTRQNQKLRDKERIANRIVRETVRIDNAVEAYVTELTKVLDKHSLSIIPRTAHHKTDKSNAVGVVHISDVHFNELVNIPSNKFDFTVASRRFMEMARKVKIFLSPFHVKNVVVIFTGDLLNSDRRLDEMLAMASNRANASFIAIDIIQQFILDLNKDYNVICASVTGNESRKTENIGFTEEVATDNYDVTIFNTLAYIFKNAPGIHFHTGNATEEYISINGFNILMLHGHGAIGNSKDIEKSVHQLIGRYASNGTTIHFVVFGHKHSTYISDFFGRSGSMVGANTYSEFGLNLPSRASQNLYVFHQNGARDAIRIDLQSPEAVGYNIIKSLESYNAKSADRLREEKTVLQIEV